MAAVYSATVSNRPATGGYHAGMTFQEEYTVRLGTFEGPLDLLLYLIRRAEVDIHDIPIVQITDQYLDAIEHLDREESLDIDAAGEFLVMAATLVELKSRTLPPIREDAEGETPEADGGEGAWDKTPTFRFRGRPRARDADG